MIRPTQPTATPLSDGQWAVHVALLVDHQSAADLSALEQAFHAAGALHGPIGRVDCALILTCPCSQCAETVWAARLEDTP